MPMRYPPLVQEQAKHQESHGADREIDPEHKRPGQVLYEEGAQDGADNRGNTKDPGDIALDPSALGWAINVADNSDCNRLYAAGSGPLQRPEQHERPHAPGEAAQERGE